MPVKAETAIVERIFHEYAAGASQLRITRNLRQDGVKTSRGGKWHQGTVRAILANPSFIYRRIKRGIRTGEFFWDAYHFLRLIARPTMEDSFGKYAYYAPERWPRHDFEAQSHTVIRYQRATRTPVAPAQTEVEIRVGS